MQILPVTPKRIFNEIRHFVLGMVHAVLDARKLHRVLNMSLFGAIDTAISGLTSQSTAFGNISEDVANSQTVGFKRVDTSFVDYLTTSTAAVNSPGAVVAHPDYINNIQGSVTQTDNPLGLAIAGQGFFAVSQPTGQANGVPTFNPQQFYSRAGDFTMNATGYLVNSAGQYLNGWSVNPSTNVVDQNALVPIQINQSTIPPLPTQNVTLAANLPATPTAGTGVAAYMSAAVPPVFVPASPLSSQITVYDALGTAHSVTLNWTQAVDPNNQPTPPVFPPQVTPNQWVVQISVPGAVATTNPPNGNADLTDAGTAAVTFGPAATTTGDATATQGTIGDVSTNINTVVDATGASVADAGTITPSVYTAPSLATNSVASTLKFVTNFGSGDQTITLNLGSYGGTTGVTQFAGSAYSLLGLTQDGVPPGSFSGVTTQANGNVIVNYNNGQTRTIAQVPVVTFNAPDSLQSQNGQAFTATPSSGTPLAEAAGTNGAGNLVTGSVEGSNVDIATEFSNLIVAQQAYSSNAKVVTTANQMLQVTLQMIT
jgi:flagellar hook protein FlgE